MSNKPVTKIGNFCSNILQNWNGRPVLKQYMVNTSWLAFGNVIQLIVGLFMSILVARYLGPEKYGMLSYAVAFVGLFSVLSSLGQQSIVVKELAKQPEHRDEILGTSAVLSIGGTMIMVGVLIMASLAIHQNHMTRILITIVLIGYIFQIPAVIIWYFQAEVLSRYTVLSQMVQLAISAFIKLMLIWMHAPLVMFALVTVVDAIVLMSALAWIYSSRVGSFFSWSLSVARAKELLNQSWPLLLSGAAVMVQARIDQVMLGAMLGNSVVGQYSVAMKMIEAFGFIPVVICNSIAPEVTKWKSSGEQNYYHGLINLYRMMAILFFMVAIPLYFFAEHIVVFLYGKSYQPAGILLALFSIRLFFTNFGVARSLFVVNNELLRYALVNSIIGATLNIILNYLLIPGYGAIGAIWATIISFAISTFFVDILYSAARRNFFAMMRGLLTPWKISLKRLSD